MHRNRDTFTNPEAEPTAAAASPLLIGTHMPPAFVVWFDVSQQLVSERPLHQQI
jgi:hypothetical protein